MGVRRERPSEERSANSVTLRFPDGTVKTMPVDDLHGQVTADVCCFCGQSVEPADPERISLAVSWIDGGQERTQTWGAHHTCLVERMHPSAANTGPFFAN